MTREELAAVVPGFDPNNAIVTDAAGTEVLSQWLDTNADGQPDELIFQTDLGAAAKVTFEIRQLTREVPTAEQFKTYGRFVRERLDDFSWENDLIAGRVYGPALEKAEGQALVSSGIDAWVKKASPLVINDWFMTGDYHADHGQGGDFYSVGRTLGCGGLGVWANGKLQTSRNFAQSRVLATGPIRLVFELDYEGWFAGGRRVTETKHIELDAGSSFNRIESRFTGLGQQARVALGIAKHEGAQVGYDAASAWLRTWEPLGDNGNLGCAVMLPAGTASEQAEEESNYLLVTDAPKDGVLHFRAGWAWDKRGIITSAATWDQHLQAVTARAQAQVTVAIDAPPTAAKGPETTAPVTSADPAK